jgi:hypothetical protein
MSTDSPQEAHEETAATTEETINEPREAGEKTPSEEQLEEPSTEKDPGEEPKKKDASAQPEPSHEAVGIGVIGGELNDAMPAAEEEPPA